MTKQLTHADLDARLDALAADPVRFTEAARDLISELDRSSAALEISDPSSWRRPALEHAPERVPLPQQFNAEVKSIIQIDRATEQRLARRIEFARLRLDVALEQTGVSRERLPKGVGTVTFGLHGMTSRGCTLPPRVCRRWFELHSLRTELLSAFSEVHEAFAEMTEIEHTMATAETDSPSYARLLKRYAEASHLVEHRQGYSLEAQTARVAAGLGFRVADLGPSQRG